MTAISYSGYRFPAEIIQHAVWIYLRFEFSPQHLDRVNAFGNLRHVERQRANCPRRIIVADLTALRLAPADRALALGLRWLPD
jgi:transposase-like protein